MSDPMDLNQILQSFVSQIRPNAGVGQANLGLNNDAGVEQLLNLLGQQGQVDTADFTNLLALMGSQGNQGAGQMPGLDQLLSMLQRKEQQESFAALQSSIGGFVNARMKEWSDSNSYDNQKHIEEEEAIQKIKDDGAAERNA